MGDIREAWWDAFCLFWIMWREKNNNTLNGVEIYTLELKTLF